MSLWWELSTSGDLHDLYKIMCRLLHTHQYCRPAKIDSHFDSFVNYPCRNTTKQAILMFSLGSPLLESSTGGWMSCVCVVCVSSILAKSLAGQCRNNWYRRIINRFRSRIHSMVLLLHGLIYAKSPAAYFGNLSTMWDKVIEKYTHILYAQCSEAIATLVDRPNQMGKNTRYVLNYRRFSSVHSSSVE